MDKKRTGKTYTPEEWMAKGKELFGEKFTDWKFKCPSCGNVASGWEFKEAGAEPNEMYQNCIGRYVEGKGCNWAAYGLFDICDVHIVEDGKKPYPVFDFAEEEATNEKV